MDETRKYLAELIGTFVLVLIGCGSAVFAGPQIGYAGIAAAFGVAVLAMVYAIGNISGCHINPAISVAMLIAGKMKVKDAGIYILMQCVGAIIAAAVLLAIATGMPGYEISVNGLGQNGYDEYSPGGFTLTACLVAEIILTMVFLLIVFGSTSKNAPEGFAGISIGLSLMMVHLVGIPITGTSVNPARSLGPALFVGGDAIGQLWLFWTAPLIGGIIAALIWRYMLDEKKIPAGAAESG